MVAAFGDLDVGVMPWRGEDARRQIVIQIQARIRRRLILNAFAYGNDAVDFVGPDNRVDLGHVLADVAAIALDQAAGHDQPFGVADAFVLGHFEDGVDGFLLGRIDKTAGVDDQHIGLIGLRGELMPAGGELAHHDFAVDKILRATETDKTDFQGDIYRITGACGRHFASSPFRPCR